MLKKYFPAVCLLLPTVLPVSAQTIDVNTATDSGSPNNTIVSQSFSTAYPNELLLVCIAADSTSSPDTTVTSISNTGPALNWTLVKRTALTKSTLDQLGTAEIWAATAVSQVTGITVTATLSQSVDSSMTILGFPSGSIGATGSGNGDPGAPTASLTTTANGSVVVGVGDDWDNAIARTVDSGQTLVHQYLAPVQDTYWVQMLTSPVPLSGTTVTIDDTVPTTDRYNMSIVEITFGQAAATTPTTYSITGTTGIGGATVALSGAAVASTTASSSGTFTFSNLANGNYSVTPSLANYTFSPASQSVAINGANISGVSFSASAQPQTYSISGTVSGTRGATVVLSGASSATTTADRSGAFIFTGLADGTYTVTPNKAGHTFAPPSQSILLNGANVTGVNFTANYNGNTATFSISGTVTPATLSAGMTVTLSGAGTATTVVGSDGSFNFTSLGNGTYTVTPSGSLATISPSSQSITINNGNVTGVNFTASTSTATYSISGTISPATLSTGMTVTLSGAGTATTSVGSDGSFNFTSLGNGTYTVTPSDGSATISPSSQSVTINNANVTGINFTAAAVILQGSCGYSLNWTDPSCQQIGSGALNPQWTVISRHGEYSQNETECNIPQAITQTPGTVSITMTASAYTCGDFSPSTGATCPASGCDTSGGDVSPASWPYSTGDIQWNTFNICPNCSTTTYPTATPCGGTCTITVVGSMPSFSTGTWPAFWLLGQNCQNSNKYTGDTGVDSCPYIGENSYAEIDTTECYGGQSTWCQFHVANPNFGIGNGCDAVYSVSTGQHTFQTVWTADSIQQYLDGNLVTTCNQSMNSPMFFIAQIQSASTTDMNPNAANLPAVMTLNSVTVTDVNGNTLFTDNFPNQN